jgi:hypothetical protein
MRRPSPQDTAGREVLAGRLKAAGKDPAKAGPVAPKVSTDTPIATDQRLPDSVIAEISNPSDRRT